MNLTHDQKKYIKKHINNQSLDQLGNSIKVKREELSIYIKKRWGEEKLKKIEDKYEIKKEIKNEDKIEKSKLDSPLKKLLTKKWVHVLLIVCLIIVTYANSINNAFVSDDIADIRDNPNVGKFSSLATRPFGFIRLLVYYLAIHLGGNNPPLFRISNILFHLGSSVLIYFILLRISNSKKIALFSSAIFAVHPAIGEAIVWISGGMYTQYTFFFLLSFLFYILSKSNVKYYLLSLLSFLFSFMSHPVMPAGLAAIFLFYEFSFGNLRKNWLKSIPYIVILIAYIFINLGALGERETTLQSVHYQEKGVDNILFLIPVALSSYFELIFWPKVLTLYHSELFFNAFSFIIRASVTLIFFSAIIYALILRKKFLFFFLSFFFIALSPTLTPFRLNWIVAERYIYLPTLGIFASIVYLLDKLATSKQKFSLIVYTTFTFIIFALLTRTIIRNIDWKNEDNLWIATGKTSPSSPNTHNNLGDVYGRRGDKQKALQEFQTAIMLKPNYADAYHNLANTYVELNEIDKALENYQKAISFNPKLWQSYQNIAAIYYQQKDYQKAEEYIQKAMSVNPKNLMLKDNLGIIYMTIGEKEKAKQIFSEVLTINPQDIIAKQGLIEASK